MTDRKLPEWQVRPAPAVAGKAIPARKLQISRAMRCAADPRLPPGGGASGPVG